MEGWFPYSLTCSDFGWWLQLVFAICGVVGSLNVSICGGVAVCR